MELQDCAFPLLKEATPCDDPLVGFKDVDAVIMVGAFPRKQGMVRADLLQKNAGIFKAQGAALDQVAKKTVKVLVVGNPANTNALITSLNAPSIPKGQITALTRLDHNRACAQIALKLGVKATQVKNAIIWGNHSKTQYPDVRNAYVLNADGSKASVPTGVNDDAYLKGDFISTIQQRGAAVIAARKLSSAMSAAKGICDHMRDWWFGTAPGEFVSMGIPSDGSYGVKEGVVYSYPVSIDKDGSYKIVQGLEIDEFSRQKMDATADELFSEAEEAKTFLAQ
jgi:malate dehydrogenase